MEPSPGTPVSTTPDPPPAVVAALRAAGCVFAEEEARLLAGAAGTPSELGDMVQRRVAGGALEHVLGWAEFCGVRIAVAPGTFVPRRRTEFLVRQAALLASPGAVVVDLCCGSGAVGVALAAAVGPVALHAVDIDPAAVACARDNLAAIGRVYQGDLFAPLPGSLRGRIDVIVANVPYVPTGDIGQLPADARRNEPRIALDGGRDGLDVQRRVSAAAPGWLAPGGHVLLETSRRQAPRVARDLIRRGLIPRVARHDELDATVVVGTLTAP
jgi:release factor glutamine methyltransferase